MEIKKYPKLLKISVDEYKLIPLLYLFNLNSVFLEPVDYLSVMLDNIYNIKTIKT
jgi:hypothetical protein